MKHLSTPIEFECKLFASEPMIEGKVMCMNWDERGRLWIVETIDYPNEKRAVGQGRDRIRILEDTDNDGKADKSTLFAEKLSIPTSLIFANGGVIVHQAPKLFFSRTPMGMMSPMYGRCFSRVGPRRTPMPAQATSTMA